MRVIADLHLHSRYSRATSKDITIQNLEKYARIKGLDVLGTGDFTFPAWLDELKKNLTEDGSGILKTETGFNFILSVEISNIYKQDGKVRKIHNMILAPGFEIAEQVNEWLGKRGRLDYDGRPIFGFTCPELVENVMGISRDCAVIPCHIWTPHFSIFGAFSGFDRIGDCFKDQTKHVFALETGLSSDPKMNWRLSALDGYTLVSFSDSHSHWPWRLGREATVFDLKNVSYENVITAMKTRKGLVETLEFFPEEGKYHLDGHRMCNVCLEPKDSMKLHNICPKCGRPMTIGVLHRIEKLADREEGFVPKGAVPFRSLVPLSEIIAAKTRGQPYSKGVWNVYNRLIEKFSSEFNVLLNVQKERMMGVVDRGIAEAVVRVREGDVKMTPGYDGEYGHVVFDNNEAPVKKRKGAESRQKSLTDF